MYALTLPGNFHANGNETRLDRIGELAPRQTARATFSNQSIIAEEIRRERNGGHLSLVVGDRLFLFFFFSFSRLRENRKLENTSSHRRPLELKIALRRAWRHFRVFDTFDNSSRGAGWFSIWVGNKHSRGDCLFPSRLNSPPRLYFHFRKTKRNESRCRVCRRFLFFFFFPRLFCCFATQPRRFFALT